MLTNAEVEYLNDIWTNPSHESPFAGPHKLYQTVKKDGTHHIGLRKIKQFLSDKRSYSLQKRVRRNFKRNRVIVQGIDFQWDSDLMQVGNISKYNKGVQYVLVIIDVFSRFLFTHPLKNKKAESVIEAIKYIFRKWKRKPKLFRFDKGGFDI